MTEPIEKGPAEELIEKLVQAAIAEEREACAKVAEGTLAPESNCAPYTPGYERRAIAAAIRART